MRESARKTKLVGLPDPELLARLLREKIDAEFGGNLNKAAKAAGISQPTLYRRVIGSRRRRGQKLLVCRSPISRVLLSKLLKFLEGSASRDVIVALISPTVSASVIQYHKWNERFQFEAVDDSRDARILSVPPEESPLWHGRLSEFRALWARLADELPHVYNDIFRLFEIPPGFARQLSKPGRQRKSGIQVVRFTTTVYRIFLPLLEAKESGWIERRGHELSRAEFRHFVESGWRRERILLSRAGDLQRAQRPPSLQALALAALPNLLPPNFKSVEPRRAKGRASKRSEPVENKSRRH